jgi:hypothetical protein
MNNHIFFPEEARSISGSSSKGKSMIVISIQWLVAPSMDE